MAAAMVYGQGALFSVHAPQGPPISLSKLQVPPLAVALSSPTPAGHVAAAAAVDRGRAGAPTPGPREGQQLNTSPIRPLPTSRGQGGVRTPPFSPAPRRSLVPQLDVPLHQASPFSSPLQSPQPPSQLRSAGAPGSASLAPAAESPWGAALAAFGTVPPPMSGCGGYGGLSTAGSGTYSALGGSTGNVASAIVGDDGRCCSPASIRTKPCTAAFGACQGDVNRGSVTSRRNGRYAPVGCAAGAASPGTGCCASSSSTSLLCTPSIAEERAVGDVLLGAGGNSAHGTSVTAAAAPNVASAAAAAAASAVVTAAAAVPARTSRGSKDSTPAAPTLRRSANFSVPSSHRDKSPALPRDEARKRAPGGVLCPRGHVMEAHVVREMLRGFEELRNGARCMRCQRPITTNDARYACAICGFDLCTGCAADPMRLAHQAAGASVNAGIASPPGGGAGSGPLGVGPGDVIACGPDAWGIHHVVLVCSDLRPDPRAGQLLEVPLGKDTFACQIIECTRGQVGTHSAWHPATTFYARDRRTGVATIVGQMEPGTHVIDHVPEPVPVKVLLHPLRAGRGGPAFDAKAFDQAVLNSAVVSQRWGLSTALKAMVGSQESLRPEDYSNAQQRRRLLSELKARWSSLPICSSVIIMVWQYYFLIAAQIAAEDPGYADDIAVRRILRWMPLFADETVPSTLLKVLTKHGWLLRGNLDA